MPLPPTSQIGPPVGTSARLGGPTVVCLGSSVAADAALCWAADHARLHHAPVTMAIRATATPSLERFADAVATVREAAPDSVLDVQRRTSLLDLRELAESGNGLLVLPADAPNAVGHALDARCRVAFVPSDPLPDGPVLLGVTASTGQPAIEEAFREAAVRDSSLRVVRVWSDPTVPVGLATPEALSVVDIVARRAQAELDEAVDGWAAEFPTVPVRKLLMADDAACALAALTCRARLLVVGRSARPVPTAIQLASPLGRVLRATHCPVLVVPNDVAERP